MKSKLIKLSTSITDGEHGSLKDRYELNGQFFVYSTENMINGKMQNLKIQPKVGKETFDKIQAKTKIQYRSILLSAVGNIGRVILVREPKINFCLISGVVVINCNKQKILPEFLYYYLQTAQAQYRLKNCGSSSSNQKHFVLNDAKQFEVVYPAMGQQIKIVNMIDPVEVAIMKNNAIIEKLAEKIMLQYNQWFVNTKFANIFSSETIQKWKEESLLSNSISRPVKIGVNHFDGDKIYISTSELDGIELDLYSKKTNFNNRESRANMEPQANSVWFARMSNSVKHCWFNQDDDLINKVILSTGFCGIQCNKNSMEYIWSIINSDWFEKSKDTYANGSTQKSITDLVLSYIKILVPDNDTLVKFHNLTKDDFDLICKLQKINRKLTEYKKVLLANLFSY